MATIFGTIHYFFLKVPKVPTGSASLGLPTLFHTFIFPWIYLALFILFLAHHKLSFSVIDSEMWTIFCFFQVLFLPLIYIYNSLRCMEKTWREKYLYISDHNKIIIVLFLIGVTMCSYAIIKWNGRRSLKSLLFPHWEKQEGHVKFPWEEGSPLRLLLERSSWGGEPSLCCCPVLCAAGHTRLCSLFPQSLTSPPCLLVSHHHSLAHLAHFHSGGCQGQVTGGRGDCQVCLDGRSGPA